jgi:hypothetical protein
LQTKQRVIRDGFPETEIAAMNVKLDAPGLLLASDKGSGAVNGRGLRILAN